MEEHPQEIAPHQWIQDFLFLLETAFHGAEARIQIARLEDHLEVKYSHSLVSHAYHSLTYSFNWLIRNWDYFEDIGMVKKQDDGAIMIENGLMYALNHFSMNIDPLSLPELPNTAPERLVRIAQKFIDLDPDSPRNK